MRLIYTKIENIERKILDGYVYFSIYDLSGKDIFDENNEIAEPSEAYNQLCEALNNMTGGGVKIVLRKNPKAENNTGGNVRDKITYYYNLGNENAGINGIGGQQQGNNGGISLMQHIQLMQEVQNLKFDLLKKDLEHSYENKKREFEDKEPPLGELEKFGIDALKDIYTNIKGNNIAKGMPAIQGHKQIEPRKTEDNQEQPISKDDLGKKIGELLIRLQNADSDFISTLEHVAALAEQHPDYYNTLVTQLKGNTTDGA